MNQKFLVNAISIPAVPAKSDRVYLVFNPSRGMPLRASLNGKSSAPQKSRPSTSVNSHTLRLEVPRTARAKSQLPVRVISRGEPVELVKVLFGARGDEDKIIAVADIDQCGGGTVNSLAPSEHSSSHLLPPAKYGRELEKVLDREPSNPLTPHRRFFAMLDQQSNTGLLHKPELSQWIEMITHELHRRLELRALRYSVDPTARPYPASIPATPLMRSLIERISMLQLTLIRQHFPPKQGGSFDLVACESAFENFATGRLRVRLPSGAWTTQPSSAYFFLFAEFAFLAHESGVDQNEWARLANVMTRTQPLYARMYAPRRTKPDDTFDDYRPCNFDTEVTDVEIQTWQRSLETEYRGFDMSKLGSSAAKNAAKAKANLFAGTTVLIGI